LLGDGDHSPFQISIAHPPYAVRVEALLRVADRLRLSEYKRGLEKISSEWGKSRWRSERTNQYRFLASTEVIDSLIEGTLGFCDQLRLWPWVKCSQKTVERSRDPGNCALEADLLTIAWGVFAQRGQEGYRLWEAAAIKAITPLNGNPADPI
jgi:hypothetical protein